MEEDQRSNAAEKTEEIEARALEKSGLFPLFGDENASFHFQKLTLAQHEGVMIDLVNTRYCVTKNRIGKLV